MLPNIQVQDRADEALEKAVQQILLKTLTANAVGQKAQTVGAPVGPYLHGPGGSFGQPGLEQPIISTHIQIVESLAASLPVRSASHRIGEGGEIYPLVPYITGFVRSDQQEKDGVCDDPPEAGNMKTCIGTAAFGRKEFKTRQVEVNRIGQTVNAGERLDGRLVNSPLVNQLGGIVAQKFALSNQQGILAGREMVIRIMEVGVAFQRWLCPTVFTGNPTNNAAGGGYKEFPGLDVLIGTNKVDAISGQACPSLYSTIRDYNYNDVQDVNAPWNMVRLMTTFLRYLTKKAVQQNMDPVQFALVMRSGMFNALVDVWPCEYLSDRCQFPNTNAGGNLTVNDMTSVDMRDRLRNGSYLLIDGKNIPVIQDDCIDESTAADDANVPVGGYMSDIYIVPLTARGGTLESMFWEFYDYRAATMPAIRDAMANVFFWSDSGRYMWSIKSPDNWCLELISKIEPRIRLLTPQLAGRITNAVYTPDFGMHFDDPLPKDPYWLDGGVPTGYPGPSPFSEWNPF